MLLFKVQFLIELACLHIQNVLCCHQVQTVPEYVKICWEGEELKCVYTCKALGSQRKVVTSVVNSGHWLGLF